MPRHRRHYRYRRRRRRTGRNSGGIGIAVVVVILLLAIGALASTSHQGQDLAVVPTDVPTAVTLDTSTPDLVADEIAPTATDIPADATTAPSAAASMGNAAQASFASALVGGAGATPAVSNLAGETAQASFDAALAGGPTPITKGAALPRRSAPKPPVPGWTNDQMAVARDWYATATSALSACRSATDGLYPAIKAQDMITLGVSGQGVADTCGASHATLAALGVPDVPSASRPQFAQILTYLIAGTDDAATAGKDAVAVGDGSADPAVAQELANKATTGNGDLAYSTTLLNTLSSQYPILSLAQVPATAPTQTDMGDTTTAASGTDSTGGVVDDTDPSLPPDTGTGACCVYVHGYYRKDGTYVHAYYRHYPRR